MANPNIVNVTTIYGNTASVAALTTATNNVVNPASSGQLYKINSLIAANINTVSSSISLELNNNGSNNYLARNVVVPANSSLVIIGKDTGIYLLENCILQVTASAAGCIVTTASWEQIS
ncbi:hypothetical protein UFOVP245_99 [uncultured Caudovirales phage]|uniref:Uncharacterized protein n=1 Tax=uncultured Caudovirales phage TaxID=2100421 RepID=A0A6J7WWF8_9CAUD|nr:hypothetical protein UFOVP245_99 [uncultured Caudovirales phage]